MSQVEMVGMGTVVCHQQPACQARLQCMELAAGGVLRQLHQQHVEIAFESTLQPWAGQQLLVQRFDGDAQGAACALHHRPAGRRLYPQYKGDTEHAFVANQPHFQRRMARQFGDQRDKRRQREIQMLILFVG